MVETNMKSIREHIGELVSEDWDYYSAGYNTVKLPSDFNSDDEHIEFIKTYFKRSGKEKLLDEIPIQIENLRYPWHITSVFLLGLIFHKKSPFLNKYTPQLHEEYRQFPFLWFMIALFHDHAYDMEGEVPSDIFDIQSFKRSYKIDYDLLSFNESTLPPAYRGNLRTSYFQYRLKSMKKLDHGLTAGMILYDKLCKIRIEKESKQNVESDEIDNSLKYYWGENLIKEYALAGNAISVHNIWVSTDSKSKQKYRYWNLHALNKPLKIRYSDFELFYLLGIVDTLEPLKAFKCISDKEMILNDILIGFNKNKFTVSKREGSPLDFNLLRLKINYFKDWLFVNHWYSDANSFTLKFN